MPNRVFTFDAALELARGIGPSAPAVVVGSGPAQVSGSNQILDLGAGGFDGMLIVNVDAIDVSSGDERYQLVLQGSSSPTFASDIENLATLDLGATASRAIGARTSGVGERQAGIVNEQEDRLYRYVRLYNVVSGTTPSISYRARLAAPAGH